MCLLQDLFAFVIWFGGVCLHDLRVVGGCHTIVLVWCDPVGEFGVAMWVKLWSQD